MVASGQELPVVERDPDERRLKAVSGHRCPVKWCGLTRSGPWLMKTQGPLQNVSQAERNRATWSRSNCPLKCYQSLVGVGIQRDSLTFPGMLLIFA